MQLKVKKIQHPQGTVPSGSWDPQRQVGTRFSVVALDLGTLCRANRTQEDVRPGLPPTAALFLPA